MLVVMKRSEKSQQFLLGTLLGILLCVTAFSLKHSVNQKASRSLSSVNSIEDKLSDVQFRVYNMSKFSLDQGMQGYLDAEQELSNRVTEGAVNKSIEKLSGLEKNLQTFFGSTDTEEARNTFAVYYWWFVLSDAQKYLQSKSGVRDVVMIRRNIFSFIKHVGEELGEANLKVGLKSYIEKGRFPGDRPQSNQILQQMNYAFKYLGEEKTKQYFRDLNL